MSILDRRKEVLEYTKCQHNALLNVERFLIDKPQWYFLFEGYAGTGKTTCIENILNAAVDEGYHIEVLALANKAARRVTEKLEHSGIKVTPRTVHSALYGEPTKDGGWVSQGLKANTLYVIDEMSMISSDIFEDFLLEVSTTENVKIILMGDGFQLEPVGKDPKLWQWEKNTKYGHHFAKQYHSILNEVKRQGDGAILDYATLTRMLKVCVVPPETTDNFHIVPSKDKDRVFLEGIIAEKDIVALASVNRDRIRLNQIARKAIYGDSCYDLEENDLLVGLANSSTIVNSEQFRVKDFEEKNRFQVVLDRIGPVDIIHYAWNDTDLFLLPTIDKPSVYHQQLASAVEFGTKGSEHLRSFVHMHKGRMKMDREVVIATYGYALTVHKSQGSEWDEVVIYSSWLSPAWDAARWFYTGKTRAAMKLHMSHSSHMKTWPREKVLEYIAKRNG